MNSVIRMLRDADRVSDCENGPLYLSTIEDILYSVRRARMEDGDAHNNIVLVTNRWLFHEWEIGINRYYMEKFGSRGILYIQHCYEPAGHSWCKCDIPEIGAMLEMHGTLSPQWKCIFALDMKDIVIGGPHGFAVRDPRRHIAFINVGPLCFS